LQELARRVERRSLESMTAYFAGVAKDVDRSLVYVPSVGASGLVWDEARAVTGPMAVASASVSVIVRTTSGEQTADATSSRRVPLAILEVPPGPPSSVPIRAASPPPAGEWIVAVWLTDQGPAFAPANFQQVSTIACGLTQTQALGSNLAPSRSMIGGGVFTTGRELLGIILPCGDQVAAIVPSGIDAMLRRTAAVEERLLAQHGALFGTVSPEERTYFTDAGGLLVREVWSETPAEAVGLRAGDLVVAVNGRPVASLDDLQPPTVSSDGEFALLIRRGSKTETVSLGSTISSSASSAGVDDPGLVLEPVAPAYRIESVVPGSRAARAGLAAGDRLVRINGSEPRSRARAERALTSPTRTPILLEIQRDRRRIAVVMPQGVSR
jgi:serine protease Do